MNFIIIPDGIEADTKGRAKEHPSFIYASVLDYVLKKAKPGDAIYLAPGNRFGGLLTEQEIGYQYLKTRKLLKTISVIYPVVNNQKYIDTKGNARYLKQSLDVQTFRQPFDLISSKVHSYRAEYCFKQLGFVIRKTHRIKILNRTGQIVNRLWYYQYKTIHFLYEILAFFKDAMELSVFVRTI